MRTIKNLWIGAIIGLCGLCLACEGIVDIDPPQHQIVKEVVFQRDETAIAAMDGIYHILYDGSVFANGGRSSVSTLSGFSADELDSYSSDIGIMEFYQNEITIANGTNLGIWASPYNIIYMSNAILEGIASSHGITEATQRQLEGEAKLIRAFIYFNLVNLFGEVPLITTTSYSTNTLASRSSIESIYAQIIRDLGDAQELLNDGYRTSERIRPNKYAALALLARVHLYLEDWGAAENYASEVIQQTSAYEILDDMDAVFLANSREAIWQVPPVINGHTNEGAIFVLENPPTFCALTQDLADVFDAEDARFVHWVGSISDGTKTFYFPNKYKVKNAIGNPTEYSMVLRFAEQYLIRAEARAQQNKLPGAIADLDVIRNRAGLSLIWETDPEIDQANLLNAIMHERRLELFTEWGHRWFDLKRWGAADGILATLKPNWQSTDVLYPIPEQERLKNPNLTQNAGY